MAERLGRAPQEIPEWFESTSDLKSEIYFYVLSPLVGVHLN